MNFLNGEDNTTLATMDIENPVAALAQVETEVLEMAA